MVDAVIETAGLRKVFRTRRGRRVVAVDALDLVVPAGGVHGFLGPDGAGKTTTIRMLLGLARPTAGEVRLFGRQVPTGLPEVVGRVGAVVEEPRFVPAFSGRKNLGLLARSVGLGRDRVDAALAQAGLDDAGREHYADYSPGMRQRLAIAAALLKSPDLVILDEPTSGLDPAGVRDIRALVASLGESGVTVLLSSHVLAEVQQLCHSVSIIGAGRLIASGSVAELVGDSTLAVARVWVADSSAAIRHLERARYRVVRNGDHLDVEGFEHPEDITRVLAREGIYVRELVPVRADLESVFLQLTQGTALGARSAASEDEGYGDQEGRR
jgi:ABC-2 type transport system ATP-binding protein